MGENTHPNESHPGSSSAMRHSEQPASAEKATPVREKDDGVPTITQPTNGVDDHEDAELSPVPSESLSPPSSLNMNSFVDEIVVGARANGGHGSHPSQLRHQTGPGPVGDDEPMVDAGDSRPSSSRLSKRTRSAAQNDAIPDHDFHAADISRESHETPSAFRPSRRPVPDSQENGVLLGYWRDSPVDNEEYKHAILATLDSRGRLRPRIQATSPSGKPVPSPLPTGPGSTEVAFMRIVFLDHLIGLHQAHIVEYVRFRNEMTPLDNSEEARRKADLAARARAAESVKANPPAELGAIAYGQEVPEDVLAPAPVGSSYKRRRTDIGYITEGRTPLPDPSALSPTAVDLDPLYGHRPTSILVGYWKGSSEQDAEDRHAIYGILGQNDMFRVKVVKETRDGRPMTGNFPTGAGALWIHYEEVEFQDHLKGLSRHEVKEYVRIRQYFIDRGERPEETSLNESIAVLNAQRRVAAGFKGGPTAGVPDSTIASAGARVDSVIAEMRNLYHHGRGKLAVSENRTRGAGRHSLGSTGELAERASSMAEQAFKAEAMQLRADRRAAASRQAASREAAALAAASAANTHLSLSPRPTYAHAHAHSGNNSTGSNNPRMRIHETDEMQRLNHIWARQEAQRQRGSEEDARVHGDVKYVRKTTGPFQDRYVSQGRVITIDGEDYVEYRVLAKTM